MKALLSILLSCIAVSVFSQNTSQYDNIPLTSAANYRKAEPQVILASDYVYSSPVDKENMNRKNAIAFIMKWMGGTSDYSFGMDETISKIAGGDNDALSMYFVCLAKYALAKGKAVDREELKYNAYLLLATYFENPGNNYKPKGEVKKLIDAKNQGKLKEFLDSKQKK
ncbi:MAG: hypothetical protein Q7U54_11155 [Bacteroidales bacterium]|nr:hypothetical protein [Bacteroidales bacterium]